MAAPRSMIILTDRYEETAEGLKREWAQADFFVIEADEFLVEHAVLATQKAYLTGERERVIVLIARRFTPIAQNKLLKILEEPPKGSHFVLMTPGKSGLLPTIRSRLPIENRLEEGGRESSGLDPARLDLATLYDFLQSHRRIDAKRARTIVESLALEATRSGLFRLDEELLEAFAQSYRLLDMGSPAHFVLSRLGLKLMNRKRQG